MANDFGIIRSYFDSFRGLRSNESVVTNILWSLESFHRVRYVVRELYGRLRSIRVFYYDVERPHYVVGYLLREILQGFYVVPERYGSISYYHPDSVKELIKAYEPIDPWGLPILTNELRVLYCFPIENPLRGSGYRIVGRGERRCNVSILSFIEFWIARNSFP